MNSSRIAAFTAFGLIIVDQATKIWAVEVFSSREFGLIGDVIELRVTRNTGAAFSSLQGFGSFIGLAAVGVIILIIAIIHRTSRQMEVAGLALVLGGAIGNLLDRIFRGDGFLDGGVVDWIDPSFFPAFNAADTAITIGAAVLLISVMRSVDHG